MASDCTPPTSPLPTDIVFNILSRLRVRDVCRLCCVSKSWLAVVSDPAFQRNHQRIGEKNPLLLITTINYAVSRCPEITLSFLDKASKTLNPVTQLTLKKEVLGNRLPTTAFACRDLVCAYHHHNVYICNPVMKKWIHLFGSSFPFPPTDREIYTLHVLFAYIASTSSYIVFRITKEVNFSIKFEVLTLGSNHWRAVDGPPGDVMRGFNFIHAGPTIDGSVYLLWYDYREGNDIITVFDLKEEAWSFVPIPYDRHNVPTAFRFIMEMCGRLCFAYWCRYKVGMCLELWLLNGLHENRPIWEKGCIIDMSMANRPTYPLAIEEERGKIFVRAISNDKGPVTYMLLCYDPKDKTMEEIYSGQIDFTASFYTESFKSLGIKGFKNVPLQNGEWRPVMEEKKFSKNTCYPTSRFEVLDEEEEELHSVRCALFE